MYYNHCNRSSRTHVRLGARFWSAYADIFLLGHLRTPVIDVSCPLDDYIPFNKYFVIPYCLWYAYIAFGIIYMIFKSKKEFLQYCAFHFTGLTICLLTFAIIPTSVSFRPVIEENDLFTRIISFLFAVDNPTNVCPSIHVFSSLVTHIALVRSSRKPLFSWMHCASAVFVALVWMSTVFLKQHSVVDGAAAALLCSILYALVYIIPWSAVFAKIKYLYTGKARQVPHP